MNEWRFLGQTILKWSGMSTTTEFIRININQVHRLADVIYDRLVLASEITQAHQSSHPSLLLHCLFISLLHGNICQANAG